MKNFQWKPISQYPKDSWGRDFLLWVTDGKHISFCYPVLYNWDDSRKQFREAVGINYWNDKNDAGLKIEKWCVVPNSKSLKP